jgi:hypothetical protein
MPIETQPYKLYKVDSGGGNPYYTYVSGPVSGVFQPATLEEARAFYKRPSGFYSTGSLTPIKASEGITEAEWFASHPGVTRGNVMASLGLVGPGSGSWYTGGEQGWQNWLNTQAQQVGSRENLNTLLSGGVVRSDTVASYQAPWGEMLTNVPLNTVKQIEAQQAAVNAGLANWGRGGVTYPKPGVDNMALNRFIANYQASHPVSGAPLTTPAGTITNQTLQNNILTGTQSTGGSQQVPQNLMDEFNRIKAAVNQLTTTNVGGANIPNYPQYNYDTSKAGAFIDSQSTADDLLMKFANQTLDRQQQAIQEKSKWGGIMQSTAEKLGLIGQQRQQEFTNVFGESQQQYFAGRAADRAALKALQDDYTKAVAARDQQIAEQHGSMASTNFINNQIAQINRNANVLLSQKSGDINTRLAQMQMKAGDYADALQSANQAVDDYVSALKIDFDMAKTFYSENADLINSLGKDYKDALIQYQNQKNQEIEWAREDARNKIEDSFKKQGLELDWYQAQTQRMDKIVSPTSQNQSIISTNASDYTWDDDALNKLTLPFSVGERTALAYQKAAILAFAYASSGKQMSWNEAKNLAAAYLPNIYDSNQTKINKILALENNIRMINQTAKVGSPEATQGKIALNQINLLKNELGIEQIRSSVQGNTINQPDGTVWQQNADGSYTRIK